MLENELGHYRSTQFQAARRALAAIGVDLDVGGMGGGMGGIRHPDAFR